MNDDLKSKLIILAKQKTLFEKDSNAFDASGGNYDDAYYLGCEDGEICLARKVLKAFNIEF